MNLIVLLAIPLGAAGLIAIVRSRSIAEAAHALASLSTLAAALLLVSRCWRAEQFETEVALGGFLRADAFSVLMVAIVSVLGSIAGWYALGYMRAEFDASHFTRVRLFYSLYHLFIFTMLLAVTTDNLGVMWVAVEGTSLATAFLVNLNNTRTSIEAAYKYLILSSVGIALAFIGTALMYYAGAARAGEIAVNWTSLRAAAPALNPQVVKLAFVFILAGYGTKAGLAPMHTWLPDAHSEAPAPVSALMSGVLLNVGLYALMRFKTVTDIVVGPAYASRRLMAMGLVSLAITALLLLTQRNFKRMLAYSSVEHTGIICLGLSFGGYWGVLGALLHMINHSLSKSLLFLLSGNVSLKYHTTRISEVRGLLASSPLTGAAFLAGSMALLGLPPFGLFVSEVIIFRAGFQGGAAWAAIAGMVLLVIVFAGMLGSVNKMLYGPPPAGMQRGDALRWPLAPLALNFALLVTLGLTMPAALRNALDQIVRALAG